MALWDYVPHTWTGLAVAPLTPLYAIGAGLNELTGGESTTWSPVAAVQAGSQGTTYSPTIQALSGYSSPTPGAGDWSVPVLNPQTPQLVGSWARSVVDNTLEGAGLPDLKQLGLGAIALLAAAAWAITQPGTERRVAQARRTVRAARGR